MVKTIQRWVCRAMFKKQRYVVRKISDFGDKDTRIQKNTRASGHRGRSNFFVWVALWLCDTVANEMLNGGRKHPVACGTGTVADTKGLFTAYTRAADAKNPRASGRSGDPLIL